MTSDPGMGSPPPAVGTLGTEDQVLVAEASDKKLRRALSFQDLFMISFGGVVGSGWLFAVSGAAGLAGPAAVISWILAGIFMIAIALCFAETASAMHKTGQLVRGPLYSHGGFTGYIIGAAYILGSITVPAIEAEAVITYSSTYIPWALSPNGVILTADGTVLAAGLMVIFFLLNYVGVKWLGRFNTVVTWWKFIIPTLTVIFLFSIFRASNFSAGGFLPGGWTAVFTAIPATGIGFAYLGFRGAAQFSGEAKNPQKDAPRAIVLSIAAAVVLYVLLQVVFIGAIHWSAAGIAVGNWGGLGSGPLHSAPFYNEMKEAGVALLAGFASFLLADAIVSPSGTGWIFLGEATRAVYGVGADGFFPRMLLAIQNRTRIPWIALIVTTVIGTIFILPFPSWYLFSAFITDAFTISLLMGPLSLLVFRKYAPRMHKPFVLPAAFWIGAVAFIGAALIVYWSEFSGLFYVFSILFVILPIFYFFYAPRNIGISQGLSATIGIVQMIGIAAISVWAYFSLYIYDVVTLTASPPGIANSVLTEHFLIYYVVLMIFIWAPTLLAGRFASPDGRRMMRAGWWILTLLSVELIVSWFSDLGTFPFGPQSGKGYIPFPYDTVIMVIVAAGIYVWGIQSGYRTKDLAEIEELLTKPDADATLA
jgi:amino acid transporter